ncbi:MAG: CHC2 zinc finger domain-containing protein [Sphingobium sp.]
MTSHSHFASYGRQRGRADFRVPDDDFRRRCDEAKAHHNLSDILQRHTTLKKRGAREMKGLCPFHEEKSPSFEVNDAKGTFYCHGCGASGDHFTALTKLDSMTFREAFEALADDTFPAVDPADRARRAKEDEAERLAAIAEAHLFWTAATDVHGTPAETYLRQCRGISVAFPPSVRFGMVPAAKNEHGQWERSYPALIGAVTLGDELVAIQRIFLRDDGTGKRWGKKSKLTLGRFRCGAIKMGNRQAAPTEIVVTEGPEDALSIAEAIPELEVWSSLGTSNMPLLHLPQSVRRVTIAGQNDKAGRAVVQAAAESLAARGVEVRTMWPEPSFKDWNDQLRGVCV